MKYRNRVLILLFFLSIITYLDRVCIAVAGPRMQADLGISLKQWGWVVGIFTLTYALFEVPTGAWGDRIGTRRVLTRIVIWWSFFTTMTGLVSNYNLLLATRALFGAGEAGAFPSGSASISRWFPTAERARAHGVMWMASRIGSVLSPLLVVPIQQAYGWRASFYVFGVIGVVWAAVWYFYYRDNPREKAGVTAEELREIGPPPTSSHQSLPWGIALRSSNLWTIMLMYHTYCWGSYFYLSWLHTYLVKGRGFAENEMKIYAALPPLCGVVGNLLGGTVSDWLVRRRGLKFGRCTVGFLGLALSAVLMCFAATTGSRMVAVACLALGYGCMDCMLPVSWAVCLDIGRKYAGTVSACMNTAGQLGSFLTSLAFGYMVDYYRGDFNAPLLPMAAMLMVSSLLFLRIDPNQQLVPDGVSGTPTPEPAAALA